MPPPTPAKSSPAAKPTRLRPPVIVTRSIDTVGWIGGEMLGRS